MRKFSQKIPTSPAYEPAQLALPPTPPELTHLDAELHRLADGIHELGFSTFGAYALERCNRGSHWAAETGTLARRLQSLPHLQALPQLTEALEAGSIGWSMAELLARHATPQTEAALLQVARVKSVQAMRQNPTVQISVTPPMIPSPSQCQPQPPTTPKPTPSASTT